MRRNILLLNLFVLLTVSSVFSSGCLSVIENSGLTGDQNDPYNAAPIQKMFNDDHTKAEFRLKEIPEQRWSVGIKPAGVLTLIESTYVPDEYIFNEIGYHKWVLKGIQPGTATVTFSYDYNGATITKHALTVYVDEEDMSLRVYNKI